MSYLQVKVCCQFPRIFTASYKRSIQDMGEFSHLFVLLRKNLKIKLRHPWLTLLELFIPTLCIYLLIMLRKSALIETYKKDTIFSSYNISNIPDSNWTSTRVMRVFYAPKSILFDEVMADVGEKLNITTEGFINEDELLQAYQNTLSDMITGIIFSNSTVKDTSSSVIHYRIRPETIQNYEWNTEIPYPLFPAPGPGNYKSIFGTPYMTFGFLPIQHAVAMSLMKNLLPELKTDFEEMFFKMQRFPYPKYTFDTFYFNSEYSFLFLICAGFLYPFANVAKFIVKEKEKRLKEALKVMGVGSSMNWLAWYFSSLTFFCLISGIITVMLCAQFTERPAIFERSNSSLVFLWLFLYSSSLISFCCFLTTLFYSKNAAVGGAVIMFFLTLMPYMHMICSHQQIPLITRTVFSLFPNTVLGYSIQIWIRSELLGIGLNWNNIYAAGAASPNFNMHEVFLTFIVNTLVHFILLWYIERAFPGKFGNPQPWYFPITRNYWFGYKRKESEQVESFGLRELKPEYFEKEPYGVRPSIEMKHLTKVFGKNEKPSVKKVCLKVYKGRITVLLGHGGCGKSATVALLLGKYPPTSGYAFIKGCNISVKREARNIPQFLGFCTDYDILIEDLSVEENLTFFCRVKGCETEGINSQVDHILGILDLDIKRKSLVSSLPSSWKRKLSVGIALIGESEVVIIDDPTANMDSFNQRIVWEALKSEKVHRTIFLTSSHMKEAEAIADKIAVIDEGEIQCCGSSTFLKAKYGAGYHLTIEKGVACNSSDVLKLIFSHIPDAKVYKNDDVLKFLLPYKTHLYHTLFYELEERKEKLKIISFSVSEKTLDEIFDKVSLKATLHVPTDSKKDESIDDENCSGSGIDEENQSLLFVKDRNEACTLFLQQATALLKKRYLFSIRHILLTGFQILSLSLIFICNNIIAQENIDNPPLHMDLKQFSDLNITLNIPLLLDRSNKKSMDFAKKFESLLKGPHRVVLMDSRDETLNEHLLELSEKDLLLYGQIYIFAVEISNNGNHSVITSYYNSKVYHSAPLSLLFVHNAILKYISKENNSIYSLNVTNHPLPSKGSQNLQILGHYQQISRFLIVMDFIVGLSNLMASFVIILVQEKSSNSKRLQLVNGLNPMRYWFLSFVYDYSLYLLSCILLLVTLSFNEAYTFSNFPQQGRLSILLLVSGISGLLFIYCCSFISNTASAAYIFVFMYYMFGLVCQFTVVLLEIASANASETLDILFSLFVPGYCAAQGFLNLHRNFKNSLACNVERVQLICHGKDKASPLFEYVCCKGKCGSVCTNWEDNYFSWKSPGIGKQIIFSLLQICVFFITIILFEKEFCSKIRLIFMNVVKKEKERPSAESKEILEKYNTFFSIPLPQLLRSHHLVVRKLSKYFGTRLAVQNLTFGVRRGECFGLIGTNECGKTTTVGMITGSIPISSGEVFINGKNTVHNSVEALQNIGICPQSDALMYHMTGEETLHLYANLRGITKQRIPNFVAHLSSILGMDHVLKHKIKKYSICNRRKLSIAVALIGTPSLIALEEPTTNMDPTSCRYVWNTLMRASALGCTILMTSKRINECEAVCNRIGIMVKGKMVYIGNLANFKEDYGEGYTVTIYLPKSRLIRRNIPSTTEPIMLFENLYPQAILKVNLHNCLSFHIPKGAIQWSKIFKTLETVKQKFKGTNYSFSETNLDHIFLHASMEQDEKEITEYIKERMREKF